MYLITISIWSFILFILWKKVGLIYYTYWYYKRQGIPCAGFPLPIFGTTIWLKKYGIVDEGEFTENPIYYYQRHFFGDELPPLVLGLNLPNGAIMYNDPEYVNELYVTKNKLYDKHSRHRNIMHDLFGDSLLFQNSTDEQLMKRKQVSAAFYKDRMIKMLTIIAHITYKRVEEWKVKFAHGNLEMVLVKEISLLIMDAISSTVFGQKNQDRTMTLRINGKEVEYKLGTALRHIFNKQFERVMNPLRFLLTPLIDSVYLGSEKETKENCQRLRNFVSQLVQERKKEMNNPDFIDQRDFLTQILQDDMFKDKESFLIDECITFMFASTQTTTLLVSNVIKHLAGEVEVTKRLREELKQGLKIQDFKSLNEDEWIKLLDYEELNNLSYLQWVISEALRINPPVSVSGGLCLTETSTIGGKLIRSDTLGLINIWYLHHNPKEWQQPSQFIPERFDPSSKYYLTPSGKKRHPMSYGPFLGGRRICLGKTFADNIGKLMATMIMTQLDFEFVNPLYNTRRPTNEFSNEEPNYTVRVRLSQ